MNKKVIKKKSKKVKYHKEYSKNDFKGKASKYEVIAKIINDFAVILELSNNKDDKKLNYLSII